ncbi:MAG: hypothetical protein DSY83_07110, partial [Flavobacteriia bacterium]
KQTWFVSPENPINERISLQKKSARGAFKKSLIFPGRGQFYTSEENFTSRRNAGYMWAGIAVSAIAGTITSWIGFSNVPCIWRKPISPTPFTGWQRTVRLLGFWLGNKWVVKQ